MATTSLLRSTSAALPTPAECHPWQDLRPCLVAVIPTIVSLHCSNHRSNFPGDFATRTDSQNSINCCLANLAMPLLRRFVTGARVDYHSPMIHKLSIFAILAL